MNFMPAFKKIMEEQSTLALATSVNNIPNVRIINFYYDPDKSGIAYFSTFKGNTKEEEFTKNSCISFTTIPASGNEHVRVTGAQVRKSEFTIYDLADAFIKKIPDYETIIEQAGSRLVLYEIQFKTAGVTLDVNSSGTIELGS